MYVEDNREVNRINMQLFRDIFHQVDLAEDGITALDMYKSSRYDIVIIDLNLPKMSGVDVIKQIKQMDENQLVIVITAYDESECSALLKDINIKHILKKPVKYKKLMSSICNCIDGLACEQL
jgi:DNA-binding response OmpR family regulator